MFIGIILLSICHEMDTFLCVSLVTLFCLPRRGYGLCLDGFAGKSIVAGYLVRRVVVAARRIQLGWFITNMTLFTCLALLVLRWCSFLLLAIGVLLLSIFPSLPRGKRGGRLYRSCNRTGAGRLSYRRPSDKGIKPPCAQFIKAPSASDRVLWTARSHNELLPLLGLASN